MKRCIHIIILTLTAISVDVFPANTVAPADIFDLHDWKLQIPGPTEIKDLKHYSSNYFYAEANHEMCFQLDAAEKGTTRNAKYIRSELRHLRNWRINEHHSIYGELKVISHLEPSKVTVFQIHGITEQGDNAPPLLRIALNQGDLYAFLKTSAAEEPTDSVLLQRHLGENYFSVGIMLQDSRLIISINNQETLNRKVGYWTFENYFKAGCYPQSKHGTVKVLYRKLTVE